MVVTPAVIVSAFIETVLSTVTPAALFIVTIPIVSGVGKLLPKVWAAVPFIVIAPDNTDTVPETPKAEPPLCIAAPVPAIVKLPPALTVKFAPPLTVPFVVAVPSVAAELTVMVCPPLVANEPPPTTVRLFKVTLEPKVATVVAFTVRLTTPEIKALKVAVCAPVPAITKVCAEAPVTKLPEAKLIFVPVPILYVVAPEPFKLAPEFKTKPPLQVIVPPAELTIELLLMVYAPVIVKTVDIPH